MKRNVIGNEKTVIPNNFSVLCEQAEKIDQALQNNIGVGKIHNEVTRLNNVYEDEDNKVDDY